MEKLKQKEERGYKGKGGAKHGYTEEEKVAFANYINGRLQSQKMLKHILPLDSSSEDLFHSCGDGILLSKLINASVPETIDERVLNTPKKDQKLNVWKRNENLNLVVNSAKAIGCKVINIGANDISEGTPHLLMGLLWQIIRIGLLSKISLKAHPQLVVLLEEDETIEDLLSLDPEELLKRWINWQLAKTVCKKRVTNFTKDIADSECYTYLLNQISDKTCQLDPMNEDDPTKRAESMLKEADKIGCREFITADDVVKKNKKLNLAFSANLFNKFPALDDVDEESDAFAEMMEFTKEGTREERVYAMWIQSFGPEVNVNALYDSLANGVVLAKVLDKLGAKVNWKVVSKKPKNNFVKKQNLKEVMSYARSLGLKLIGIGGEDIEEKNKTLVLGMLWQLMYYNMMDMLVKLSDDGKKIKDKDILKWANAKVKSAGVNQRISGFTDKSLKTGEFLCYLCYACSPRSVNKEMILDGGEEENKDEVYEMNIKYAISCARKIGCQVFLSWEDVLEVKKRMILTFVAALMLVDSEKTKDKQEDQSEEDMEE